MKKIPLIFVILFCLNISFAQQLQFGLKLSPHVGWAKSDKLTMIKNNGIGFGFSYGLVADYNIKDNYGLNFEFNHSMINFNTIRIDSSIVHKWSQQYVELPVSLKMKTNEINNIIYYGKIGVGPKINTSAKIGKKTEIQENNKNDINFFNAAFVIGGGIHYALGGSTMALAGLSFHNGLMRVNRSRRDIFESLSLKDVQLKNSFVSLDLGILF